MIIFICKGNLYRSRFAAAIFQKITGIHADSYGTHTWNGTVLCTKFIQSVKQQFDVDVSGNIKHVTRDVLMRATSIYYMSYDNLLALKAYKLPSYNHMQPLVYNGSNIGHQGLDIPDPGYLQDITTKTFTQDIFDALNFRFQNGLW